MVTLTLLTGVLHSLSLFKLKQLVERSRFLQFMSQTQQFVRISLDMSVICRVRLPVFTPFLGRAFGSLV